MATFKSWGLIAWHKREIWDTLTHFFVLCTNACMYGTYTCSELSLAHICLIIITIISIIMIMKKRWKKRKLHACPHMNQRACHCVLAMFVRPVTRASITAGKQNNLSSLLQRRTDRTFSFRPNQRNSEPKLLRLLPSSCTCTFSFSFFLLFQSIVRLLLAVGCFLIQRGNSDALFLPTTLERGYVFTLSWLKAVTWPDWGPIEDLGFLPL